MRVFPDLTVDGEFKALGDTGVSGSLNDRQYDYLGNSGYTGSLPDRFGEYKGFTPASLFSSASSRGFMFDFRDYNTLFTDTAGTTRVTSTNQSVGLALDKSQGLALGPELITNGTFNTNTAGWVENGNTLAVVSGQMEVTTSAISGTYQTITTQAGRTYRLTAIISRGTAADVRLRAVDGPSFVSPVLGETATVTSTSPTSVTILFVALSSQTTIYLRNGGAGTGYYDNVTVRELAGNHATQATLGNRPLSVIFPSSGVRNRANGSADVGNGSIWASPLVSNGITHTRVASGFDTDGLPYVDYSVVGTASANAIVGLYTTAFSRNGASLGQQWTGSVIAQIISGSAPPSASGLRIDIYGETAPSTGTEAFIGTLFRSTSAATVSNSATLANAATNQIRVDAVARTEAGATVNYTVRIKALQFELGSSRTSYQFNYSAQNVTEPGFASIRGIQFDGVDDWLQTAAIDFSNSDEVTVVAGVRKLSDAARGSIVELTTALSNRFAFEGPDSVGARYAFVSHGTVAIPAGASGFAAPISSVLGGQGKISTDLCLLRVNGAQVATSALDQGTGNYANAIVYIGRRSGDSLPYNGVLTFLFAINRLLTANELAAVEAYANGRTGAF